MLGKLPSKENQLGSIKEQIGEASTLLLETDNFVNQIALEVGYQNINHFYHQFRNYHQTTPQSWREKQHSHALL